MWEEYFSKLFNECGESSAMLGNLSHFEEDKNYMFHRHIYPNEIKQSLEKMRMVKQSLEKMEVWKCMGEEGTFRLMESFNVIHKSKRMLNKWRKSTLVPMYKNKCAVQSCENYRGIKLISHTMKLWKRVLGLRLRRETKVLENQFGFMPLRSIKEAIYLLSNLMKNV